MTAQERAAVAVIDDRYAQHPRWRPGERLHDLFAELVDRHGERTAMDSAGTGYSFADLDRRARTIAAVLQHRGVDAGDRVALLLDRPVDAYAAMLAVSRLGAAFVPLDAAFPADRIDYICHDADVRVVLTAAHLHDCLLDRGLRLDVIDVESADAVEPFAPSVAPAQAAHDALAYVIYTSGTTGRPKGVAVNHSSICNFVRVAAEVYGFAADDRVYQGMTIAFDFSVEESWVPWMAGATLVPRPAGGALVGADLQAFVRQQRITALCCVPTLLSTLDAEALGSVRFVLVSGEACPPELVARWHRPGRRFLNVYGPTEATVTATWSELHPDRAVTLGRPLPTYTVVLLDQDDDRVVAPGGVGEIGLAGVGLAQGYLGRADLTSAAFVDDFLTLPNNPSQRIYRTGDLGQLDAAGQLRYLGRIDTQVKVRGYRIELTEIESVLLGVHGVGQAVVETWEPVVGMTELVAYYTLRDDAIVESDLHAALSARLPAYMVPAYFQRLDVLPMTTSDKVDRKALPAPTGGRWVAGAGDRVRPETAHERALTEIVEHVLDVRDPSVTSDLFTELGANSLVMARLCAEARSAGLSLSITDCYRFRTIRGLAAEMGMLPTSSTDHGSGRPAASSVADTRSPGRRSLAFVATGAAQLALTFGYLWLLIAIGAAVYDRTATVWSTVAVLPVEVVVVCGVPIAVKWLLVGRWRAGSFPVWSPRYLRFWVVKTLVRGNPLVLFAGTPVYNLYLRALGARIGPRAIVQTRHAPVCTDLLEIGADAVVRTDVYALGYHVRDGVVHVGSIEVAARAYVGTSSVLDIDTVVAADGQLAHASSLSAGQTVPQGERWHGSPARPAPADSDFQRMAIDRADAGRSVVVRALVGLLVAAVVLAVAAAVELGELWLLRPGTSGVTALVGHAALAVTVTLVGGLVLAALAAVTVGRWAGRALRPGTRYRVRSTRHALLRLVDWASNRPLLITLFGDSSLITGWMRLLGWDLGRVVQTGSNFGTTHRHEVPGLARVGSGTMISDGLSMVQTDVSSTHFRVRETVLGEQSFLGNRIVYPAGARVGDNVLLATKVLVPVDGAWHHDVGLLGSPAFEIPRSVDRDRIDVPAESLPGLLASKLRHNVRTMAWLLLSRWVQLFVSFVLWVSAADAFGRAGSAGAALLVLASVLLSALWFVAAERMAMRRRVVPRQCSIHDRYFWRHERLWKLLTPYLAVFDGTPFKPQFLRLLGVRVGARLFDDGASLPEHQLVSFGDDCTLNAGTVVQGHSLEDGMFKSDRISLGHHVTTGVGAFVHYGTRMADHSELGADAFLMKGSEVGHGSRWSGNPAVPSTDGA